MYPYWWKSIEKNLNFVNIYFSCYAEKNVDVELYASLRFSFRDCAIHQRKAQKKLYIKNADIVKSFLSGGQDLRISS